MKRVFVAALEAEPGQRSDVLRALCGDDAGLRAAVDELLRWNEVDCRLLDDPTETGPLQVGETGHRLESIAGFGIIDELGRGGMGIVFRALQDVPRREVALKLLASTLPRPDEIRRFNRELDILARLNHPGIVRIYEAGTTDLGLGDHPYFTMELVEGATLTEYLAAGRTPSTILAIFLQICDAVEYAHRQGVLHRDLKPKNVLVDESGHVRLIDFGIARLFGGERATTGRYTAFGTLPYMSPEQQSGALADARTDVYALGVVLFEALSGAPLETSMPGVRSVEAVSQQSARRLAPDLEAIVRKATAETPDERYDGVAELAADVRRYVAGGAVHARRRWWALDGHRPRFVTWVAAVVLFGMALVFAWMLVPPESGVVDGSGDFPEVNGREIELVDALRQGRFDDVVARAQGLGVELDSLTSSLLDERTDLAPSKCVLEAIDAGAHLEARLLAAAYLQRDGILDHPGLEQFLLNDLESGERVFALRAIGRLFYERPDGTPLAVAASRSFRELLERLLEETEEPEVLAFALMALGGSGNATSLDRILTFLEVLDVHEANTSFRELLRLGLLAGESITRRAVDAGFGWAMSGSCREFLLRASALYDDAASMIHGPGRHREILDDWFVANALMRARLGRPPLDLRPRDGDQRIPDRILAARGDEGLRWRLRAGAQSFIGGNEPSHVASSVQGYATMCYLSRTNPGPHGIASVKYWAKVQGLDRVLIYERLLEGIKAGSEARVGVRSAFEPDSDTRLLHMLDVGPGALFELPTVRSEHIDPNLLARWSVERDKVVLRGAARAARSCGVRILRDESALDAWYMRLGLPGSARLELIFGLDPEHLGHRDLVLQIHALKAQRRYVPEMGEARIRAWIGDRDLGEFRLEPVWGDHTIPVEAEGIVGADHCELRIEVTSHTTTTVRLSDVELRLR